MTDNTDDLVKKFKIALQADHKLPATIESYGRDAEEFLRYLNEHNIIPRSAPPESLLWFREYLLHDAEDADNSVRRKIIGIRQFYRFLVADNIVSDSPFDGMPIPERDESMDKPLTLCEFQRVLSNVSGSNLKQARDTAILNLLSWEGLKANELISLRLNDFIEGSTDSKSFLNITGERSRSIQLHRTSSQSLTEYRRIFSKFIDSLKDDSRDLFPWLFVAFKGKDGQTVLNKMTRHGLKFMLSELGEKSKIRNLHSETLRHLAINRMITSGNSPEQIMSHLGLRQLGNIGKHMARSRSLNVE